MSYYYIYICHRYTEGSRLLGLSAHGGTLPGEAFVEGAFENGVRRRDLEMEQKIMMARAVKAVAWCRSFMNISILIYTSYTDYKLL